MSPSRCDNVCVKRMQLCCSKACGRVWVVTFRTEKSWTAPRLYHLLYLLSLLDILQHLGLRLVQYGMHYFRCSASMLLWHATYLEDRCELAFDLPRFVRRWYTNRCSWVHLLLRTPFLPIKWLPEQYVRKESIAPEHLLVTTRNFVALNTSRASLLLCEPKNPSLRSTLQRQVDNIMSSSALDRI